MRTLASLALTDKEVWQTRNRSMHPAWRRMPIGAISEAGQIAVIPNPDLRPVLVFPTVNSLIGVISPELARICPGVEVLPRSSMGTVGCWTGSYDEPSTACVATCILSKVT